ncbi:hypothetical protein MHTCC0001_31910 [Flavobacteriaceae bacterium MHTCC 0001]
MLQAKDILTAQLPDILLFEEKKYLLHTKPLKRYFNVYPNKKPQGGVKLPNLRRGYLAYFEIRDRQLVLKDIKIMVDDKDSNSGYPYKWISVLHEVFPDGKKMKIDWYSRILVVPYGKVVAYVQKEYASENSDYLLLEIDTGNFNEARRYTNEVFKDFNKK